VETRVHPAIPLDVIKNSARIRELFHGECPFSNSIMNRENSTQGRPYADATDATALAPGPLGPRVMVIVHFCQIHLALENSVETPYKFHC